VGDRALAARARVARSSLRLFTVEKDLDEVRTVTDAAILELGELDDPRGLAEAYQLHGQTYARTGRIAAALQDYEHALAAAGAAGNASARRAIVSSTAFNLYRGPVPAGEAIRLCEEMIRSSPADPVLEATVTRCMSAPLAMCGRAEEALALVESSGRLLDELDIFGPSIVWLEAAAEALELAGDRRGAMRELETKWLRLDELAIGSFDIQAMGAAYRLALLHCDEGSWDEAERCVAYRADPPESPFFYEALPLRLAVEARLAGRAGRHAEAVTLAERAVAIVDECDIPNLRAKIREALAEVQWAAGNEAAAGEAMAAALGLYEQKGNVAAAAVSTARLARPSAR
jgi:tetratricopeptide (TPR) repeat protein